MYDTLLRFGVDPVVAKDISDTFNEMTEKRAAPSGYWECIGTGAYKECYLVGNVAIKFASKDNNTLMREMPVYNAAVEDGFSKAFAKTSFLALGQTLASEFIGYDEDAFDCVVVQEKVSVLGDMENYHCIFRDVPPIYENGKQLPFSEFRLIAEVFTYQEWIQAGIDHYGLDFMRSLANFCENNGVRDLHSGNLGFRSDGSPVIFDFLS